MKGRGTCPPSVISLFTMGLPRQLKCTFSFGAESDVPDATISMWELTGTLNFSFTEVCLKITKSDVGPTKSCVTVSKDRFMPGLSVPLTNLVKQKEHKTTHSQFTQIILSIL